MHSNVKRFIMNLPMKRKLSILCFGLVLFSTFLSTSAVYIYISNVIKKDAEKYAQEVMVQSKNYLDEKMKGIIFKTNYLQLNSDYISILKDIFQDTEKEDYSNEEAKILDILERLRTDEDLIDSICILTDFHSFFTFNSGIDKSMVFTETELYQRIQPGRVIEWGMPADKDFSTQGRDILPIVLPVTIYMQNTPNAFILVNLKTTVLQKQLSDIAANINGNVYIVNGEGELVLSNLSGETANNNLRQQLKQARDNDGILEGYQISQSAFEVNDWSIGCIQSDMVLLKNVYMVRKIMILIGICSVAVFTFIAGIWADSITRPLKKLQHMMQQAVQVEFEQQFHAKYEDEVGQLAAGFDDMCVRIRNLMTCVEQEQQQKRTAELKALNDQINPHFLYNTLDCIYWACMRNDNKDIAEVAFNMSNLFRLGLNKGKETTTIAYEVKHVKSYMDIQKNIYKGKFEYSIECQEEIMNYGIIKLLLQPLAENSILHGFQRRESGGRIRIRVFKSKAGIVLYVEDNGTGDTSFFEEHLSGNEKDGLAVSNIEKRLALHYHGKASLSYRQAEEGGLVAKIIIPYQEGELQDV